MIEEVTHMQLARAMEVFGFQISGLFILCKLVITINDARYNLTYSPVTLLLFLEM